MRLETTAGRTYIVGAHIAGGHDEDSVLERQRPIDGEVRC